MKVKKNKSKQLTISEVDKTYVIAVKYQDEWHILQALDVHSEEFEMLGLGVWGKDNDLTNHNSRGPGFLEYWFKNCQEMHVFKTTKKAFKFLIKKL